MIGVDAVGEDAAVDGEREDGHARETVFGISDVGLKLLDLLLSSIFRRSVLLRTPGEGRDELGLPTEDVSTVETPGRLKREKEGETSQLVVPERSRRERKRKRDEFTSSSFFIYRKTILAYIFPTDLSSVSTMIYQ